MKMIFSSLLIFILATCNSAEVKNVDLIAKELNNTEEEQLVKTIWDTADTTISNEARLDLFKDSVTQASGGIYIGVGSIQNLTLASWAKSDFIYLMDFTEVVVHANKVHLAFIKESKAPEEYLQLWNKTNQKKAEELLTKHYGSSPQYKDIIMALAKSRPYFSSYIAKMKNATTKYNYKIYYQDAELYNYIRNLALTNRIRPIKGNLLGSTTMQSIGKTANTLGEKIRIVYLSNAEEYNVFKPYPENFIKNIQSLPTDEKSIIIRTMSVFRWTHEWAEGSEIIVDKGFHYGSESLGEFQDCLSRVKKLYIYDAFKAGKKIRPGLSLGACPVAGK